MQALGLLPQQHLQATLVVQDRRGAGIMLFQDVVDVLERLDQVTGARPGR
ncbi:hypothetical protein ACQUSR_33445 [Streptomyces sp. P1-3]